MKIKSEINYVNECGGGGGITKVRGKYDTKEQTAMNIQTSEKEMTEQRRTGH